MHDSLHRLEQRLEGLVGAVEHRGRAASRVVPAWRRATVGEPRWPATVAVIAMIFMQLALPLRLAPTGRWLLPAIEAAILAVLFVANPTRISHRSPFLRGLGLTLTGVASLANAFSAGALVVGLVRGTEGNDPGALLLTGANIWLTNVIIFSLWYWELDRGGPASRAHATDTEPDFVFPQMLNPTMASPDWEPYFVDYLYLAFTNATAFSPTDTLPFSRWSKLAMMLQSAISLATGALVIARAVNILR